MFKFELKLRLNFTNISGLALGALSASHGSWQGVGIGALLILGRKGISLVKIYILHKYK